MTSFPRLALLAGLAIALGPLGAPAAVPGVAYDSVTKFGVTGSDQPVPGTFQADYDAAATVRPAAPHVPFGLGKMVGAMQNAAAMLTKGTAEKWTIGATKERTDEPALGTAEITDCTARTLTSLDLRKKTYTVTSLDQPKSAEPATAPAAHGRPAPVATDDGTRYKIDVATRALGAMTLGGVATTGFATAIRMSAIKPSGETQTSQFDMTSYVGTMTEPQFACPSPHETDIGRSGASAAALAQYALALKAMRTPSGDPRFTVTHSGPPVPAGKFALWSLLTMTGQSGPSGFYVETEHGNVRPASDNDPALSVPPDFTKES